MSKPIVSVLFICLIIYNLCPDCANASKVKLIKKLVKAKLIKGIGKGVTKIVIPFLIPIPFPKKFPMFMTTMSAIPMSNSAPYPMAYDNSMHSMMGFDANQFNNFNNIDYNKSPDNSMTSMLFPRPPMY